MRKGAAKSGRPNFESEVPEASSELKQASELGTRIHEAIGLVAQAHGSCASPQQVMSVTKQLDFGRGRSPNQAAKRQRTITAAAAYFRNFARPGWKYEGREVIVDDVALDLLWSNGGRLQADEIKTGFSAVEQGETLARRQAESQCGAGRTRFGSSFEGVRVVLLGSVSQSFFVSSPGELHE